MDRPRRACATEGCDQPADAHNVYCMDCELAEQCGIQSSRHDGPAERGPLMDDYRVSCMACSYDRWLRLEATLTMCVRVPRCPACGGFLILEQDRGGRVQAA